MIASPPPETVLRETKGKQLCYHCLVPNCVKFLPNVGKNHQCNFLILEQIVTYRVPFVETRYIVIESSFLVAIDIYVFRNKPFKNFRECWEDRYWSKVSLSYKQIYFGYRTDLACFHAFGKYDFLIQSVVNNTGQRSNYGIRNKFDKSDRNYVGPFQYFQTLTKLLTKPRVYKRQFNVSYNNCIHMTL